MPRLAIALCLLAMTSACVTLRPLGPIEPGTLPALEPDEGILVIHVHTEIPIAKLQISRFTALTNLPKGEHFRLLVVNSGNHRWSAVSVFAGDREVTFKGGRGEFWQFRVEPGRINYPGEITIRGRVRNKAVSVSPIEVRNRSALALRRLRESFPDLLQHYPPIYTGYKSDGYLDYYGKTFLAPEPEPEPRIWTGTAAADPR